MLERIIVHKGSYHDSAHLMRLAVELKGLDGVAEAEVLMGTDMNRELLQAAGFTSAALADATPMDLVVALRAATEAALDAAEQELARLMQATETRREGTGQRRAADLREALAGAPEANLVSVAVPGAYAAYVARQALDTGRHVFLFSDNVAVEDEVALKQRAREQGLLVMGPDCGTAILAGVGLGFANRVRPGHVGLVGASGTGIQEISCLVHRAGHGVSHAIGTGSHDLSAEVDALMTEAGVRLLADDDATHVIVVVAKHPDKPVAERLHAVLAGAGKPVVVRYLGQTARHVRDGILYASCLDEAAECALGVLEDAEHRLVFHSALEAVPRVAPGDRVPVHGRLVGLFGGGSLASEAALVLREADIAVEVPDEALPTDAPPPGTAHLVVDVGDDFYTVGRPHPMVDQTVRCALLRAAGSDPSVGLLLLDLVLGDGSHPDPAPEIAAAVTEARQAREARGDPPLVVIASVTGTDLDPQDTARQQRVLTDADVVVKPSAYRAARLAAALLNETRERSPS